MPELPDNWIERALEYRPTGPDTPWAEAAMGALENLGAPALAITDVQKLVWRALGKVRDTPFRNLDWVTAIPQHDWSVASAWEERGGRTFKPGLVWSAVQTFRSVDDELAALYRFGVIGYDVVREPRKQGVPDWHLRSPERSFYVEAKSKGARGEALDLMKSAMTCVQLLDTSPIGLRRFHWHVNTPRNKANASAVAHRGGLDRVISTLFDLRAPLSDLVGSIGEDRMYEVPLASSTGMPVTARVRGPDVTIRIATDPENSNYLDFVGAPSGIDRWVFLPHRSEAGFVPGRVREDELKQIEKLLHKLVLAGRRPGRQLERAPKDTLILVRWHAPWLWDDALADNPTDLESLVESLSSKAAEYRETALGLWTEALSRTDGRVLLNGAGRELLGVPYIEGPPRYS